MREPLSPLPSIPEELERRSDVGPLGAVKPTNMTEVGAINNVIANSVPVNIKSRYTKAAANVSTISEVSENLNRVQRMKRTVVFQSKNLASVSGLGLGVTTETTTIVTSELSTMTTTGMISNAESPSGTSIRNARRPPGVCKP